VVVACRWIRFEENVEEGGERWSKPHVATLSLHALFELRRGLGSGTVMLDADAANIAQVAGKSWDVSLSAYRSLSAFETQEIKLVAAIMLTLRTLLTLIYFLPARPAGSSGDRILCILALKSDICWHKIYEFFSENQFTTVCQVYG